jgi:hypothetical protein
MKSVATYSRWMFLLEAVVRIPVGLLLLTVAFVAVPLMIKQEVAEGHGSWGALVFDIFPLVLGYLIFSSGVRRVHAALLKNCWFKAGTEGISFRLPYQARPKTFFLTNKIVELTLPWTDVLRMYPLLNANFCQLISVPISVHQWLTRQAFTPSIRRRRANATVSTARPSMVASVAGSGITINLS